MVQIFFIKVCNLVIMYILAINFFGRKSLIFLEILFVIEKNLLSLQSLI